MKAGLCRGSCRAFHFQSPGILAGTLLIPWAVFATVAAALAGSRAPGHLYSDEATSVLCVSQTKVIDPGAHPHPHGAAGSLTGTRKAQGALELQRGQSQVMLVAMEKGPRNALALAFPLFTI